MHSFTYIGQDVVVVLTMLGIAWVLTSATAQIIQWCGSSPRPLTYQLLLVWYWHIVAFTGYGESGFDSGEGALGMATTLKEGSRGATFPISLQGGSGKT